MGNNHPCYFYREVASLPHSNSHGERPGTLHFLFLIYVVVKFLFQVIFVFLLFFGMVMYANEVETKEK